jgi:hypothetical protein
MMNVSPNIQGQAQAATSTFDRIVIDANTDWNNHKAKVFAAFSKDKVNDLGAHTGAGFMLYRYAENWKAYNIFEPSGNFEDASAADINGDGALDIVIGGWSGVTLWAVNPAGRGLDPYTTPWPVHIVDKSRFSHEVVAADLSHHGDGKCDIVTTSGIYLQGSTPDSWTFVGIERTGQGTFAANMLGNGDGWNDVVALHSNDGKNQIAWFENPGHTGGNPATDRWRVHIIDANPGGDYANSEMTCMAFTVGDVNGDGRPDLIAASQGEGPDAGKEPKTIGDPRQIGDGLVWYEAPANPRTGAWIKHVIDPAAGWVHASSIKLADFDGDGRPDVCFAEQDQSVYRQDGRAGQQLGIFYNLGGGLSWKHQVLSQHPDDAAGGFNSKVGIVGNDKLPSIFTSRHGYFGEANPLLLWRNRGVAPSAATAA